LAAFEGGINAGLRDRAGEIWKCEANHDQGPREAYVEESESDQPQPWQFVGVDGLARLIACVTELPPGYLGPDCVSETPT
jgi:hypothetical protein